MNQYGTYGMGDFKSKEWYVYDRIAGRIISTSKFRTKKLAKQEADKLNKENKCINYF